jgi:hypothetical protein
MEGDGGGLISHDADGLQSKRQRIHKRRRRAKPVSDLVKKPAGPASPAEDDKPCILRWTQQMTRAEDDLQKAVVITVISDRERVPIEEIAELIAPRLELEERSLIIRQYSESSFILFLPGCDMVEILVGNWPFLRAATFTITCRKWSRFLNSRGVVLLILLDIELQGIPIHAWETITVEQLLSPFASVHQVHPDTLELKDVVVYRCSAWCLDTSLVPASRELWIVEPPFAIDGVSSGRRTLMYPIRITFSSAPRRDGSDPKLQAITSSGDGFGNVQQGSPFSRPPHSLRGRGEDGHLGRLSVHERLGPRDENMQQRNISSEMAVSDLRTTLESDWGTLSPRLIEMTDDRVLTSPVKAKQLKVYSRQRLKNVLTLEGAGAPNTVTVLPPSPTDVADADTVPSEYPVLDVDAVLATPFGTLPSSLSDVAAAHAAPSEASALDIDAELAAPSEEDLPTTQDSVEINAREQFISRLSNQITRVLPIPKSVRRQSSTPLAVPRCSRRVAGVGVEFKIQDWGKRSKKQAMVALNIIEDNEGFSRQALDDYAKLFKNTLSCSHVRALAALFGWSVPDNLEYDNGTGDITAASIF